MAWSRKKENLLNLLRTRLRSLISTRSKSRRSYLALDSHIRIPILVNTIHVTQASTQTPPVHINNNHASNASVAKRTHRRKYQHRFKKCLAELIEKYPPIPAHDDLIEDCSKRSGDSTAVTSSSTDQMHWNVWSKLLESREDLAKLNQTLEDLDHRLERLSLNICLKCQEKDRAC